MTDTRHSPADNATGVIEATASPRLQRPPQYKVILLNDDYTPMEFVVTVLEQFFAMNRERAMRIMLHVHYHGEGICGIFSHEIAETKIFQVEEYARHHQHPLRCRMEPA